MSWYLVIDLDNPRSCGTLVYAHNRIAAVFEALVICERNGSLHHPRLKVI